MRQYDIERIPCPANSPDLAAIEHIWDELSLAVRNNHPLPNIVKQLIRFLTDEWHALP